MATTVLWIAAGVALALLIVWRLRRANHALNAILREERERTDVEPAPFDAMDEPVSHKPGRHRKRD